MPEKYPPVVCVQRPEVLKDVLQRKVYEITKNLLERDLPNFDPAQGGRCIAWSLAGQEVLLAFGIEAQIVAGSLQWPILVPDDGISSTHFGYMWSPYTSISQKIIAMGRLPEMHVWLTTPHCEVIDFSTGGIKENCTALGFKWQAPDAPEFVWGKPPEGAFYRAYPDARKFLDRFIMKDGKQLRCNELPIFREPMIRIGMVGPPV